MSNTHDREDSAPVFVGARNHCIRCACPCAGYACIRCVELSLVDPLPAIEDLPSGSMWETAPSGGSDSERRMARRKRTGR